MRPLAVLILVLGALAALFFALFSGGEGRAQRQAPRIDQPRAQGSQDEDLEEPLLALTQAPVSVPVVSSGGSRNATQLPTDPSASFAGYITGQVLDTNGYQVPAATIKLIQIPEGALVIDRSLMMLGEERAKDPIAVVSSLANGEFAIDGVQAGDRWGLVVSHPDYTGATVGPLVVPTEGGLEHQQIELQPGNTLFGTVRSKASGVAIPGASVALSSPMAAFREASKRGAGSSEAVTDERGAYRFTNTDRSTKTLIIRAPGYATAIYNNFTAVPPPVVERKPVVLGRRKQAKPVEPVFEEAIARQFDIQLEDSMSIAGRVVAPDGSGVAGAELQAYCLTNEVGSHGQTLSVAGGEFLLEDLGPGQYSISVQAKGYHCLPIQRVEAGETALKIELIQQGSVAGRAIQDSSGRALTKFTCTVRTYYADNLAAGQQVIRRSFSDRSNGSFRIDGLNPGEYVVEVKARGLASSFSAPFNVERGKLTGDISVRVTEGGTLRGSVTDASSGRPLAGVKIKTEENNYIDSPLLIALGNSGQSASTQEEVLTAEDGTFEIKLMTPATYQVQITKNGFSPVTLNGIKVGDGGETVLEPTSMLSGALVQGYVWDTDGSGVAGANVMLTPEDDSNHWATRSVRTDAEGRYVMQNVAPGDYELSSSRPSKPGAGFLDNALDMKKSSIKIQLLESSSNEFNLDFNPKKP